MKPINYLRKVEKVELLDSREFNNIQIRPEFVEEVRRSFLNASRVFAMSIDKKVTSKGTFIYYLANRSGHNAPIGPYYSIYLGLFLTSLFQQQVDDRSIRDWLCLEYMCENYTNKDGKRELTECSVKLSNNLNKIHSYFNSPDSLSLMKVNELESDLEQFISDLLSSKENFNDWYELVNNNLGFFVINTILEFIIAYRTCFSNANHDEKHICQMYAVPLAGDSSGILELFKSYKLSRFKKERLQTQLDLYTINFQEMDIKNGSVVIPESFYENLIGYAVEGCWCTTIHMMSWLLQFKTFCSTVVEYSKQSYGYFYKDNQRILPEQLDVLLPENFMATVDSNTKVNLSWFNDTCKQVIADFTDFVCEFYEKSSSFLLPATNIRKTTINGIPSIYRIDLFENKIKKIKTFVCRSDEKKTTSNQRNEVSFSCENGTVFEDVAPNEILKIKDGKSNSKHFGRNFLSKEYEKEWRRSLCDFVISTINETTIEVKLRSNASTILPPLYAVRHLDVYDGNEIRSSQSASYESKVIDALSQECSLLDLFFAYKNSEIDYTRLEQLYEARLYQLGKTSSLRVDYKYESLPSITYSLLDYSTLLSLAGLPNSNFVCNKLLINLSNSAIKKSITPNSKIVDRYSIPRYVTLRVPVDKRRINRLILEKAKGKILYKDTEVIAGKTKLKLMDEPWLDGVDQHLITSYVTVDLFSMTDISKNIVSYTDDHITLRRNNLPFGLDSLRGNYGEFGVIQEGSKLLTRSAVKNLTDPGLSSRDYYNACFEVFSRLLDNVRLFDFIDFEWFKDKITNLKDFMVENLNIDGETTFSSFENCFSNLKILETLDSILKSNQEHFRTLVAKITCDLRGEMYASSIQASPLFDFNPKSILDNLLKGLKFYPSSQDGINLKTNFFNSGVFENSTILENMLKILLNSSLEKFKW